MKAVIKKLAQSLLMSAVVLNPMVAGAAAITMSATYYTIAEGDQDMNSLAFGVYANEVQNTLGPNGLPILNTAAFGCTSNCFMATPLPADVTANGEITWWSPSLNKGGTGGVSDVVKTGTSTISLPYSNGGFYPPNGAGPNDANGFQAAVFSTTLNVPTSEKISFNVGADDVAFVYLDGTVVCDLGGVHGDSAGACTSSTLAAGNHTLELFYADLYQTQAQLTFDVATSGVTGTPTPEPAEWSMLGIAFVIFGLIGRKR